MAKNNRDDFTETTKTRIAKRAGWLCSDPSCRRATIGATSDGDGEINLGVAAHICAAAPGGPRYDDTMTPEQRKSPDNGIWMCSLHSKAVDAPDSTFTVALLRTWKAQAQKDSWERVLYDNPTGGIIGWTYTPSELGATLRAAAAADLDVFRRSKNWSSVSIELTLKVEGLSDPVSASGLASVLTALDDLILVAPPGTGKTTTLLQIADAVLAAQSASPLVVPLGPWSADGASLIEYILKRPAFRGISEDDLRAVAAKPGVIILLDGWNELDGAARRRATAQIERLKLELPELGLLIATRRQALDVPVDGVRVELQPLDEGQQISIARALRGDEGERILDRAWRTSGLRELVNIPLYLTVLLAFPIGAPFPETKEEVLRWFVDAHENDGQCAAALAAVTHGLHQRFLEDLAATATNIGNTTITDAIARRSISSTDDVLVAEGQITEKPQPAVVLDALVSHHLLLRAGDPAGYSFQHQQFQEWFASGYVEHMMLAALDDDNARHRLKTLVLDRMPWEEAILFACERLARGNGQNLDACGAAILAAFSVDPMLAAEMIYRSTTAVWMRVGPTILGLVSRWHTPGIVDRAVRFMIASGRHEFFDQVWPLVTDENDQVSLSALRAARYFRTSLFGGSVAERICVLPLKVRKIVLQEIVFYGGADGIDLSADIAKEDPEPEVKASVVEALAFRRADRHVADVLRHADDATFDLLSDSGLTQVLDEQVRNKLEAAVERRRRVSISLYGQLNKIYVEPYNDGYASELTELISTMEINKQEGGELQLIFTLRNRYPRAIADGILHRLRLGRDLFHHADDLLADAGFSLEDGALVEIALSDDRPQDVRPAAAMSVLGPLSVGRVIDVLLETKAGLRDTSGRYNKGAGDRYHDLLHRVAHARGPNLIAAIQARSASADNETMASLAELIWRHPTGENDRGRPFNTDSVATIATLLQDWSDRLLASGSATRAQLASVVQLVNRSPTVILLPTLKRLLDEELRQWRTFRHQALAGQFRDDKATNEARMVWTTQYQNALIAIRDPATATLMSDYLPDIDFGQCAAIVLAERWRAANDRSDHTRSRFGVDFSYVEEKRAARSAHPETTSTEAEVIFGAIEKLIVSEASNDQKKHAVALGIVGARLPHGERSATLQKLLELAPRTPRAALVQSLILSGEVVDISVVKNGIAEVLEAAKTQTWILLQDGYQLKEWLRLLPFTNRPADALAIVHELPAAQRNPRFLEEMLSAFGMAQSPEAEEVLFQFAEADPRLYDNHTWRESILRRGSLSAARRFIDLVVGGVYDLRMSGHLRMSVDLARLITEHPALRSHTYDLLMSMSGSISRSIEHLIQAVVEAPDTDGLLLLIGIELKHKRSFVTWHTIEKVITAHIAVENSSGAYNVVPVSAAGLRKKLLAIAGNCELANPAASCLDQIDRVRDIYGAPESDPRHPDLASGQAWPSIKPSLNDKAA